LLAIEKSPAFAPEIATLLIVIDEGRPLDSVAVWVALADPTTDVPKERLEGLADTLPEVPPVPKPVSVTL
jgi:hypothetical protein